MQMENINVKKRLMFVKGEDFYFLSYNILIILDLLGCYSSIKKFKDYRKLAFLIDFVADYNLANIISRNENHNQLNSLDRELLMRTYSNGMIRLNQIIRLLFTLEKRGLIQLEKDATSSIVDVSLQKQMIPENLFDTELFQSELNNSIFLKNNIKRLSSLTLETTLQKLFDNYGITRWAVY
jgi:hypothetical protein